MSFTEFIHLRSRSSYSIAEGAIKLDSLLDLTAKNNMPAIALTDKGNLFGSLEFSLKAADKGIQPIIGCIVDLDINISHKKDENINSKNKDNLSQILLLAKDNEGWKNLSNLVTCNYLNQSKQQISCQHLFHLLIYLPYL